MNHMYYDVSNLNAQWDDVPLQGLGGGVLASPGGIGVLGLGVTYDYPASATKAAQAQYNVWAKNVGYCPIAEDGKMGPATCGALKAFAEQSAYGGATNIGGGYPSVCASFTPPKKEPCTAAAPPPAPPPVTTELTNLVTPASAGSGSGWLIFGGVVAVGAVGAALYFTRKGR